MDTSMCRSATRGVGNGWIAAALLFTALPIAAQQIAPSPLRPNWRRVGSFTMDLALASPATGPVSRVWFSPDGSRLYALAAEGRVFESEDLETWSPAANPGAAAELPPPVNGAKLYRHPQNSQLVFALGAHLYRSGDGGASWMNVTAAGDTSVIGAGQ